MRGLGKRLRAGRIEVGQSIGIQIFAADGALIDSIAPASIAATDWGTVYERWVGQEQEKEGWEVDYRGLTLGFLDRGLDLVAFKDGTTRYLQCKYKQSSMSKQDVQHILYKASQFLDKELLVRDDVFELVIPSIEKVFPIKSKKNKQAQPNQARRFFMGANKSQSRIQVSITEIPMPLGPLYDRPEPDLPPIA
ncbi:hypothetical protein [Pseudomonas luteola]|uniref:hypothetical protein n=1 Tax=Pseudomonas luteola TaxID=47886 RepID=UPI00289B22E2|nr:hypothetical protein [Pseudomonas luteola]